MTDAKSRHWNSSPILWDYSNFKHKEKFVKQVEEIINIYGIDAALKTPDYLLAEYILNCLINFGNTLISIDRKEAAQ